MMAHFLPQHDPVRAPIDSGAVPVQNSDHIILSANTSTELTNDCYDAAHTH